MKHVFQCKLQGWNNEYDIVWFDAQHYTKEQALAKFEEKQGWTVKANGKDYPYTYWEYDGVKYYSVTYMGLLSDDEMPSAKEE